MSWATLKTYCKILVLAQLVVFFLFNCLNISGTHACFTSQVNASLVRIQAGGWGIEDEDILAQVTDPNPSKGKHYNIRSNKPVQVEISNLRGYSLEDVLPDSVTLGYLGDAVAAAQYQLQRDVLRLTFKNITSILSGKLPPGSTEIYITISGQLHNGITFNKTCLLLVHVPPGNINEAVGPYLVESTNKEQAELNNKVEKTSIENDDTESIAEPDNNQQKEEVKEDEDCSNPEPLEEMATEDNATSHTENLEINDRPDSKQVIKTETESRKEDKYEDDGIETANGENKN